MSDDVYVTLAQAAKLIGRPLRTVKTWADRCQLGRYRWHRGRRLVQLGRVRERDEQSDEAPNDLTAEELESLIAKRSERLPRWWWADLKKLNGQEFADRKRSEYEAERAARKERNQ